jgi:midasin (ATPase involved in ribosome maturation)
MPQTANQIAQCIYCNQTINIGEPIAWSRRGETGKYHPNCKPALPAGSDILAQTMAAALQPYMTAQREEITDELESYISQRIEKALSNLPKELKTVYIQSGQTIGQFDGHKHEHFDLLVSLVSMREDVFLWGEAGSGKSSAAHQIADMLGLDFYYLGLQAQMTESRLMGYMDATGKYIESDFYKAYARGGVFLLDELALASGNLLGSLNGALANGRASFPCGITKRHEDFICIATDNTPCMGATVMYSDRRALDGSVRDRFAFVQWDTDRTLEQQIASQYFDRSEAWVNWIQAIRPTIKANYPKITCTQRASIRGSKLIAGGIDARQVADMFVFRGADTITVNAILSAHPLPTF